MSLRNHVDGIFGVFGTMKAPLPENESRRLESLGHYQILDTLPEPDFDDLTRLASQLCEVPIALISLIDAQRQWFKSRVGLDATETHRDLAFCAHAILEKNETLVVPDATQDERFSDNPLVTADPSIRFYLGVPLVDSGGYPLGTLCVIDRVPRRLTPQQVYAVKVLGRQVISQIELRAKMRYMADLVDQVESAKTELEYSNRDLAQFASVASHDLQTPLRQVRMLGERLRMDCAGQISPEGHDYIERISSASERMQRLLVDLMTYSLVTTTVRPVQEVDLMKLVGEVVSDLDACIQEVSGRVEVQQLPRIQADETQMRQLFQNLISNAIKFHRKTVAPVVRIETQIIAGREGLKDADDLIGSGPWCRILVKDNGIGFKANHSDQIFRIFKRLHTPQHYEGTGVGLSICKRVVERHDGVIKAQSEAGQGATFIITLPLQQKADQRSVPGHWQDLPAA